MQRARKGGAEQRGTLLGFSRCALDEQRLDGQEFAFLGERTVWIARAMFLRDGERALGSGADDAACTLKHGQLGDWVADSLSDEARARWGRVLGHRFGAKARL